MFAEKGANIMISDINEEGGQETVAMVKAKGQKAAFCKADASNLTQVKNLV